MDKNLVLNWSDFINITDLTYNEKGEGGVYLWGFTIENTFVPYYIGITDNIIYRIHEHLNLIIGGRYTIYHHDSLVNFKGFKKQGVQEDKSQGIIYSPDWPKGYKHFIDIRKMLQPHIDYMIDRFTFSFAKVDQQQITSNNLEDIEKICIAQIGIENLANQRGGYSDKFIIQHIGNPNITKLVKSNSR